MPEYQLQIKQVVDYPRCRIYREFIHKLINDRSIRINGGSGLFHFTSMTKISLCPMAATDGICTSGVIPLTAPQTHPNGISHISR